jgi:hypothetical protein
MTVAVTAEVDDARELAAASSAERLGRGVEDPGYRCGRGLLLRLAKAQGSILYDCDTVIVIHDDRRSAWLF